MDLPEALSQALSAGNVAALPLALLGGLVAGWNPCCLALYPAAAGVCCCAQEYGQEQAIKRPLGNALAFVLGVAVAVALLGALAAYIGRVVVIGAPLKYAIAALPIVMGFDRLGWVRLPLPAPKALRPGIGGAFGSGLLLSLVIGPCGAPVFVSVLSYAAQEQSFLYGFLLLFLYGLGNGLPLVLVGTAAGGAVQRVAGGRFGPWVDPIAGSLLVLLGLYLLWRI